MPHGVVKSGLRVSPVQYAPTHSDCTGPQEAMPWAHPMGASCEHVPWADHLVKVLVASGNLPRHVPGGITQPVRVQIWSDGSGINSEMFALADLNEAFARCLHTKLEWNLYFCCVSDMASLGFAERNHKPSHTSKDMKFRTLGVTNTPQFGCDTCNMNHDMPIDGIDLYVGTYQCSPWFRQGKRTRCDHPSAALFRTGVSTIRHMQPATWIMELGEVPHERAAERIQQEIITGINRQDKQPYVVHMLMNLSPLTTGYPMQRPRTFMVGWRADMGDAMALGRPLASLLANPFLPQLSYIGFLKLHRFVDLTRVGQYPTELELAKLVMTRRDRMACRCGVDPMVLCTVHTCKCGHCGDYGMGCAWRKRLRRHIADKNLCVPEPAKLSYIQVLEVNGIMHPVQPGCRTWLNILALHPEAQPLNNTLMVADLSRAPGFGSLLLDGTVPTWTPTSAMHSFQCGHTLTTYHLSCLMGLNLNGVDLRGVHEAWIRRQLGLGIHIPNFGLVLLAVMAMPLNMLWRGHGATYD